jgi:outer membrane protein assembly factor BamB
MTPLSSDWSSKQKLLDISILFILVLTAIQPLIYAADVDVKWAATNTQTYTSPVIDNDTVYSVSASGRLVALSAQTGVRKFTIELNAPVSVAPAVLGQMIYVATDLGIQAVGKDGSGTKIVYSTDSPILTSPLVYDASTLIAVAKDGKLHVLDVGDPSKIKASRIITLPTPTEGSAVVYNKKVYIFLSDGRMYSTDPQTGSSVLLMDTGRTVWRSMPVAANDTIYVGADRYFMGITSTGSINLSKEMGGILHGPAFDGSKFYIGSDDGNLYAIDQLGDVAWKFKADDAVRATPLVVNNTVYFGSNDKRVYALDATNGSLKWSKLLDDWPSSPVYSNGMVYATTLNGTTFAISTISCRVTFPVQNATIFARASLAGQAYADVGIGKVEVRTVPGDFQSTSGLGEWSTVLPIVGASEGQIPIQCKVTDRAGNVELEPYTEVLYNYVFSEEKLPKINVTAPPSVTVKSPFTLQFKDAGGKPLSNLSVTIEGVKYPVNDPNGLFTFIPTREGPLTLFIEKPNYQTKIVSIQVQQSLLLYYIAGFVVLVALAIYFLRFRRGRWR